MTDQTATMQHLKDLVKATDLELMDVLTLLHFAIDEAAECRFDIEGSDEARMTCRLSRFVALLSMTRDRVVGTIQNLEAHT